MWKKRSRRARGVRYVLAACLAAVLLAGSVPAGAAGGNRWKGLVRSVACVKGPDVLLGEIADPVDAVAQRQWPTLSTVKLWKASDRLGHVVTVPRDKLRRILEYYMGEEAGNLALPSQLTVQTGGRVVDSSELTSRIVAFLTPKAKGLGGDVKLNNLQMPDHIFFPNDYDRLVVDMKGDFKPGRNDIMLCGVTPDGKVISRRSAVVFADVWKAVPVAARPMNRNERVTANKVSFRRMNLAYNRDVWDGTGGPWRMTRTLGRGQVFTQSHLEPVPLVERGEMVNLVFNGRGIRLSIKAEAMGEAGAGQQVEVRNTQSNKIVLATVVDSETVVVR
ncbi:flagellar basal body P-ring formation chaperone FlgA [Pseudodesulfovibrio thermohalotolerans]|uniref:flagellar basal body P-ring formation chaperone FlgA n=1 Tax=Pseudodesulfovibrio thermohalotolerans TaxID=2880651 RepID=UPI0024431F64|nr:flagellar basal body P-ring formation chaperone FlgA [Pseudodesulfovibrio thermohalotolerans]WFS63791.1 flagellar basal body P-ring formation chaperone FlgA [Pseudodesulfovibrio thermohalotolerans]